MTKNKVFHFIFEIFNALTSYTPHFATPGRQSIQTELNRFETVDFVTSQTMLFEPDRAGLAARGISFENLERLLETVERMRCHVKNPEVAITAGSDFHKVLGESTGNALVESFVRFVMTATGSERLVTLISQEGVERALIGHERILAAVAAGDEEGAAKAMKEHLQGAVAFARNF